MGIDLANAENDWNGMTGEAYANINHVGTAAPLPEAVIDDGTGGTTASAGIETNSQHNPQGRRMWKSTALENLTTSYTHGKWMTFRIPLRHIFRWLNHYNGCLSGVQSDIRIYFYRENAMLLNASFSTATTIPPGTELEFKTVHLDVARLTVDRPLSLSREISMTIPDQFTMYRNTLEDIGSNNASLFILNSVDRITRLTFFFLLKRKDIGTQNTIDKNFFPYTDIKLTDFRCYINDRLIPKTPLTVDYYDTVTDNAGTGLAPLRGDTFYGDVTQLYELYQKRTHNTLENREDFNWQASGTISYDTYEKFYFHIPIDVTHGLEYDSMMKNITVQFTCGENIPNCTMRKISTLN